MKYKIVLLTSLLLPSIGYSAPNSGNKDVTNNVTNTLTNNNNNDIIVEGDTLRNDNRISNSSNAVIEYDVASASAAPTFSNNCSGGISSQGIKGGVSVSNNSIVCRNLMMADAYLRLAGIAKTEKLQIKHMDKAIEYLEEAGMTVKRTSKTGFIAQVANDLAIPLAALLLLLLL